MKVKYTYKLLYPNGEEEMASEVFDTEEQAESAALYDCYCFVQGRDILKMMGDRDDDEIIEGECEYEIIKVEE